MYVCLQINKRGAAPEGGGVVTFGCPIKPKLLPVQYTDPGKVSLKLPAVPVFTNSSYLSSLVLGLLIGFLVLKI